MIAALGSAAVVASIIFSSLIVKYAGRERPPDVEQLRETGILVGYPGMIYSKTKEGREFGTEMGQIWESFCPDAVAGLDVGKLLMTVYVTKGIRKLSANELEVLVSNTARALQRRFGATTSTVLVVENDQTILEVRYDSLSRSVHVKSYE